MLQQKIQNEYKESMKAKDVIRKDILNFIISQIKYKKIEIQKEPGDDDIIQIIKKEIKTRSESIEFLKNNGKKEEIEIESAKLEILKSYLPKMLSEDELRNLIQLKIQELGVVDIAKERGKIIGIIMKDYKSVIDSSMLNNIINSLIK